MSTMRLLPPGPRAREHAERLAARAPGGRGRKRMNARRPPSSRGTALALLVALLSAVSGCIVPLPESRVLWGRGAIPGSATESLVAGETTREEVLLRLGAPDLVAGDGRIFVYSWGVLVGVVGTPYFGGLPLGASRCVVLEFDEVGRLARFQRFDRGDSRPAQDQVAEVLLAWASPDGVGLGDLNLRIDPLPDLWTHLPAQAPLANQVRIRVVEFKDARPAPYSGTMIGRRWEGVIRMAAIHAYRPVSEILSACIAKQLEREGGLPAESGADWTLTGVIETFKAEETTVELEITLEARSSAEPPAVLRRRYTTTAEGSPYTGVDLEDAVRSALLKLQEQVAEDGELAKRLGLRR